MLKDSSTIYHDKENSPISVIYSYDDNQVII